MGDGDDVALNACVIRFWNKKQKRTDHLVLVTTDLKWLKSESGHEGT
jgi:hypothetical protein